MRDRSVTRGPLSVRAVDPKRILLVKTASLDSFQAALTSLHSAFPNAEVYVWTEERESDKLFARADIGELVLYLNIPSIPGMLQQLRSLKPDYVALQVTGESTYDKLKLLAVLFFRGDGAVLDAWGRFASQGTWQERVALTSRDILHGLHLTHRGWKVLWLIAQPARRLAVLAMYPFLFIWLLIGAIRAELTRRAYFLRRGRPS